MSFGVVDGGPHPLRSIDAATEGATVPPDDEQAPAARATAHSVARTRVRGMAEE